MGRDRGRGRGGCVGCDGVRALNFCFCLLREEDQEGGGRAKQRGENEKRAKYIYFPADEANGCCCRIPGNIHTDRGLSTEFYRILPTGVFSGMFSGMNLPSELSRLQYITGPMYPWKVIGRILVDDFFPEGVRTEVFYRPKYTGRLLLTAV